jgi:hypothetical protein
MPSKYASGKHSIAECDRCGQRYKLAELRKLVIKTKMVSIKVCLECWEPDQPQLQLGMYPVNDPQAVREPRPDISYYASGVDSLGYVSGGSRVFQWGWNPVGGASNFDTVLTPNYLIAVGQVGTVTISTT